MEGGRERERDRGRERLRERADATLSASNQIPINPGIPLSILTKTAAHNRNIKLISNAIKIG